MADEAPDFIDNGWLSVPWAQYITKNGTPVGDTAAAAYGEGMRANFTIGVFADDLLQAIQDIVGTHEFNSATGLLDRTPAVQHPLYPQLRAEGINSIVPQKSLGKTTDDETGLVRSEWGYYWLAITFACPDYVIMDDATLEEVYSRPRQEWQRYVVPRAQNASTYLVRPANNMFYTLTGGNGPGDEVAVVQDLQVLVSTQEISLEWMLVPVDGLFGGGGVRTPANVLAGVGKINDAEFAGYPAGTLRLNSADTEPMKSPVNVGGDPGIYVPPLLARVRLSLTYFNPPYGGTGSPGTGDDEYLPWNLVPFPGPVPFGNGQWFLVTSEKDGTGTELYETYPFPNLFDLAS